MIRKFIFWLFCILHIKKRDNRTSIEVLNEILPYLYVCVMIVGFVRQFGPFPPLSLLKRVLFRIRLWIRRWRMIVVGY